MSEQQRQGAERDLYRDTWVRYLGERRSDIRRDPTTPWGNQTNQWSWAANLESERGLSYYSAWAGDRAQEEARDLSKVTQHCGSSSVHGTLLEAQTECMGCPLP